MSHIITMKSIRQCKESITICCLGSLIAEERCMLDRDHRGPHRHPKGQWVTQAQLQSIIEWEGLK